jgi:two-component system, OmpR family, osmolarity sensor histidine kinase EnvZ
MQLFQLRSYFWKILSTIGVVSIGFMAIVLTTIAFYMVIPLGQRATDDLASIFSHAAETWELLSPDERETFKAQMHEKHYLTLESPGLELPDSTSLLPYLFFLEQSLSRQHGKTIPIKTSTDASGEVWFWADIPTSQGVLRFGFPRSRIGVKPSAAFFILLISGFILTFITATVLTRRLTATIERLYQAAQLIGKGQWPDPVPEEGPEELVVLAREFNRMNIQVKELLANRAVLFAGISHDLRTPLTQIRLALEMLPGDGGDPALMSGIRRDLESVDRLIGQALEVNLELDQQKRELVTIEEIIDPIVESARRGDNTIEWSGSKSCSFTLNSLALQRIITNLLENALRYGDGKPVTMECSCDIQNLTLQILDRGPGIPPDQREAVFQPFVRLEKSRNSKTGGSGLGLAIVRQLANTNGWVVKILGREGGGTCAQLVIPIQ